METHLYALCLNEADILEFFFHHYDPWIDRYIIFDDGSTDGSIEILESHPKVELRKWQRLFPDSYIYSQIYWLDEAWKESRGRADWVVIVDMDEHLFVPRTPMIKLLESYKAEGITMVPALGFNMRSWDFPETGEHLIKTRTIGKTFSWMCKLSIFNPDAIKETNFTSGRHFSRTVGHLKIPKRDELLLLHYKYLGFERTIKKQNRHYHNMGAYDNATGIEQRLIASRKEMHNLWEETLKVSSDMNWSDYDPDSYPDLFRWWRPIRQLLAIIGENFYRPFHTLFRLKEFFIQHFNLNQSINFKKIMGEINKSPIKKEIYDLTINGGVDGNNNNTVAIVNGEDEVGILVHCLHSSNLIEMSDINNHQNIKDAKILSETKYQKTFKVFIITNGKGFTSKALKIAKENNIRLINRNELMTFIANIEID